MDSPFEVLLLHSLLMLRSPQLLLKPFNCLIHSLHHKLPATPIWKVPGTFIATPVHTVKLKPILSVLPRLVFHLLLHFSSFLFFQNCLHKFLLLQLTEDPLILLNLLAVSKREVSNLFIPLFIFPLQFLPVFPQFFIRFQQCFLLINPVSGYVLLLLVQLLPPPCGFLQVLVEFFQTRFFLDFGFFAHLVLQGSFEVVELGVVEDDFFGGTRLFVHEFLQEGPGD